MEAMHADRVICWCLFAGQHVGATVRSGVEAAAHATAMLRLTGNSHTSISSSAHLRELPIVRPVV